MFPRCQVCQNNLNNLKTHFALYNYILFHYLDSLNTEDTKIATWSHLLLTAFFVYLKFLAKLLDFFSAVLLATLPTFSGHICLISCMYSSVGFLYKIFDHVVVISLFNINSLHYIRAHSVFVFVMIISFPIVN